MRNIFNNFKIIPRNVSTGVTNPDQNCFVLQNGALQPIAQAISVSTVNERPSKGPSTRAQTPVAKSSQLSDSETASNHQDSSKNAKRRDTHNR